MARTFEGKLSGEGLRIAVVASRFNEAISESLLQGALECLREHGVEEVDIEIFRVPGAFEVPQTVARLCRSRSVDGVVTTGTLIRGETPHFDHISAQVTDGISRVAEQSGTPVSFGVITCDTVEQARARSGDSGNKGWEAALAAIEMIRLYREIGS